MCKKAWNSGEAFFGELKGGLVKDFPIGFCRELLQQGDVLTLLGQKLKFNVSIGFNGRVWVDARMSDTIFIMTSLERAVAQGEKAKELIDRL